MSLSTLYYKPPIDTLTEADLRGELDWIGNLTGGGGDRILLRELVMYVWAHSVSDSVTERKILQSHIDHRLAQLREIAGA